VAKITKAPKNVVELMKMRHSMDELPNAISEMQCRTPLQSTLLI
jgi:hypothetical protein